MNREEYSDYIGKKYEHLLIQNIYSGEISGKKTKVALCKCDCGNLKEVHLYDLLREKVSSCSECYKGTSYKYFIGKKYEHLLIQNIYSGEISGQKTKVALCKCDCGNIKEFKFFSIINNVYKYCGDCYNGTPYSSFIGKKYGLLTVQDVEKNMATVKCDCGNLKEIHLHYLLRGKVISCAECYNGTPFSSLIEKKYGYLTLLDIQAGKNGREAICKCDCGNIKKIKLFGFIKRSYTSCGNCYKGTPYSSFIGKKYGLLTVQDVEKNMATVKCDCGNLTEVKIYHLLSGNNTSCGKCLNGISYSSFIGKKYGYLTVINIESGKNGKKALCKCKCGNIKKVELFALLNGKTNSCGCFHKTFNYLKLVSFGKLHIMKTANNNEDGLRYICKCDCGNEIEVLESDLFTGKVICCESCNY